MNETSSRRAPVPRRVRRRWRVLAGMLAVVGAVVVGTLSIAQTDWGEARLQEWIIPQVEAAMGCELSYSRLDLHVMSPRPRAVARDVTCDWTDPEGPKSATADSVVVEFARFQTYANSVHITAITAHQPVVTVRVVDDEMVGIHLGQSRDVGTYEVSVDEIRVQNGSLQVDDEDRDTRVILNEVWAVVTPDVDWNARVELTSRGRSLRVGDFEEVLGELDAHLYVNNEPLTVEVVNADLTMGSAQVTAAGTVGPEAALDLDLGGTLPLRYVNRIAQDAPVLDGVARYQGNLVLRDEGKFEATGRVRVPGFRVDDWPLGDVSAQLDANPSRVEINDLKAEGLGGGTVTGQLTVSTAPGFLTRGDLWAQNVRFERLLENSGVLDSHVTAGLTGKLTLEGTADPIAFNAEVAADIDRFTVRDRSFHQSDPEMILDLPPATLEARALWRHDGFDLISGRTTVGQATRAMAQGFMRFPAEDGSDPGFLDFVYEIGALDFREIGSIGSVAMKGVGTGAGRVVGELEQAVVTTEADIRGYDLEDVAFGDATGTVVWKNGILSSPNTVIRKRRTVYQGDWELDLNQDEAPITFNVVSEQGRLSDLLAISDPFRIVAEDVDGDIGRITASLSGPIHELTGTFSGNATNVTAWGERFRTARITRGRFTDGRIELGNVYAEKKAGRVYGRGTLETDGRINGEVRTEAFTLDEFDRLGSEFPVTSRVAARLNLGGTTDKVALNGWVKLNDTILADRRPLSASRIDLVTKDDVLTIDADIGGEITSEVTIDLEEGLPYRGKLRVLQHPLDPYLGLFNPAVADGVGRVSGTVTASGQVMDLANSLVQINVADLFIARGARNVRSPRLFTLILDKGALTVDPHRRLHLIGPVNPNTGRPRGDLVTDLEIEGTSRDARGNLDFRARGRVDLAFVDLLFDVFTRIEGEAVLTSAPRPGVRRGEPDEDWPATLTGPPDDPQLDLWAQVQEFAVRSKPFPVAVEDVRGLVHITDERVVFGATANGEASCRPGAGVEGKAGGGEFLGCGTLDLDGIRVTNWDVKGQLLRPGRMRWDDPRMRVMVKSPPGQFLTMRGRPHEDLLLSGALDVEELRYQENFDWKAKAVAVREPRLLQAVPDESDELFDFDVLLRAPEGGIFLKNADANIETKGQIRIVGSTAQWGMLGNLTLIQGTARFQDTEFNLTSGSIEFDDDSAVDFEVDVNGEAVVRDYTVYVSVNGRYLDDTMSFDFESQPPLSQDQIHMLLLLKVPPGELTGQELSAAGALIGSVAGEGYAEQEGLLDVLRGGLPLDSVEVVPTYSETGGDIGVSIVGRKLLGKKKNTEMTISLRPALRGNTEASTAWQLEHKATRRLRFSFGCDHGDREGGSGGSNDETPEALQDIRSIGDCTADAKFRFEFR